ncbi:hypothetical protein I7I48_04954 [Histoplasma ohiense]|nr:hypothetical protein I7I48_04954 [Histoplasma ohiense (nom. inval.)]
MPVFGNEVEDKEVQESSQHKEQNRTRYDGYLEQNFQLLGPFYNIYYVAKHWCLSKKKQKKNLHPDYSGVATSGEIFLNLIPLMIRCVGTRADVWRGYQQQPQRAP